MFYRLREGYGEQRQLHDAPAMMFLSYESADLTTFIELALMFGWDFYLLPCEKYGMVFASHDEYVELYTDDPEKATWARDCLQPKANDSATSC